MTLFESHISIFDKEINMFYILIFVFSYIVSKAKKVDANGASGLIPSQNLEEKRKAFVKPEYDYTHKSRKLELAYK